jgi:hypothetical protein
MDNRLWTAQDSFVVHESLFGAGCGVVRFLKCNVLFVRVLKGE